MERVAAGYPLRQGGRHGTWKFSRETGSSRLLAGVRELPPLRGLPGAAPASCLSALVALGKRGRSVRSRRYANGLASQSEPACTRRPALFPKGQCPICGPVAYSRCQKCQKMVCGRHLAHHLCKKEAQREDHGSAPADGDTLRRGEAAYRQWEGARRRPGPPRP